MGEEGVSQGVDPPLGYRFLPTSQLMPMGAKASKLTLTNNQLVFRSGWVR